MHAEQVCHKIMNNACAWMHELRREALNAGILAAIKGQRLTVTGLGRAIAGEAKEKHNIKRADRLLSNIHLHQERKTIYQMMTQLVIGNARRPLVLIDWSNLDERSEHFLLRAAVSVDGRSLSLYEEVHGVERKEKPMVHRQFLRHLKCVLPSNCEPIIVTDSGFRTPWFKTVEQMGWDWVGRIRNRNKVRQAGCSNWVDSKSYYSQASIQPKYLGEVELTRNNPFECRLVVYKSKSKGRIKKTQMGKRAASKHSNQNAKRESEPWLLATSLPVTSTLAKRVVSIYRTRMQIEEAFRDTKSVNFGLGFELNNTRTIQRLQILLMIAMLAALVLWILGAIAEATLQHREHQANTISKRRVLSLIFLGLRVASDKRFEMQDSDILDAAQYLWETINQHAIHW